LRVLTLTMFLALSGGCATFSASSSTDAAGDKNALTMSVASPPPAEKAESDKPAAPGFGYIWVAGYWDYLDGNYIWRDGRWMQGKADYEYVRARYEHDAQGWVFHRPHWKRRHAGTSTQQAAASR
jgi:WXXGXW repeat (2 copies)